VERRGVVSFLPARRLPGAARVSSWGCAARSLIARLQVCDSGLVVTVGVLFWFPVGVGVLGRLLSTSCRALGLLGLLLVRFCDVGLLGLMFVRFWGEG
jgi:hypothetical protein